MRSLLDDAHAEAGEVVVVAVVHARHLGRLAADQRAARQLAAVGDAADDGLGDVDAQLAAREVVEEEERLGAGHERRRSRSSRRGRCRSCRGGRCRRRAAASCRRRRCPRPARVA